MANDHVAAHERVGDQERDGLSHIVGVPNPADRSLAGILCKNRAFLFGNRWASSYIDKENAPWIEYDVDLAPGGTYEGLKDQSGIWQDALNHFRKFIGW